MTSQVLVPSENPPLFGSIDDPSSGSGGVTGQGGHNPGVIGSSVHDDGVRGVTETIDRHGVIGRNSNSEAFGSLGGSDPVFKQHAGVYGESDQQGVMGLSTDDKGTGVYGGNTNQANHGIGVRGETMSGVGVQGQSFADGLAGEFIGNVDITGKLTGGEINSSGNMSAANQITAVDVVLSGADCAEEFDIAGPEAVEAGTVMVIDQAGELRPCAGAYDKKVTGVISGAGDYKPGIILGKRQSPANRLPLALVGKVYCRVDAQFGPIEIGDLLTTSSTLGHAMKAADPFKAFGAVIGKALRPVAAGRDLIPILVALQ